MTLQPDRWRAFVALVLAVQLVIMTGWLLVIGKNLLLPIFIAVISVYVLVTASDRLGQLPVTRRLPGWARHLIVLVAFFLAVMGLVGVIIGTAEQVIARLPAYQQNLQAVAQTLLGQVGMRDLPNWDGLMTRLTDAVRLQKLAAWGLGSVGSLGGVMFMAIVYASFLMAERAGFAHKVAVALPGDGARQSHDIVRSINRAIGDYLAVKTLVNVILAALSYAVLWVLGVDFALFWAILIGLLNYIPYVGSMLGVAFPVVLTVAQFGDLRNTAITLTLLAAAQIWVGNSLEPRMVGRKVNLSPFVVMVALALWGSIWGVSGAILAIPMTSIIAIVMASFAQTRPFAVLLADDVSVFEAPPQGPGLADRPQP